MRAKDVHKDACIEALRRAKFKFPGRQKIRLSRKWGFTKYNRDVFEKLMSENRLRIDGNSVQYDNHHGPLGY